MRKLATIRQIKSIEPIENADRIEKATVDGWHVVVSKSDNFKVGDLVVYIEIDSQLPKTEQYEFLKSRKYVVKTITIRGQVSQGLIMPLSVLPQKALPYKLGDDVTGILGITKYDPELEEEKKWTAPQKKTKSPIAKFLCRYAWFRKIYLKPKKSGNFPDWIKKTDEERIQNKTELFDYMRQHNTQLSVTEKVDGTSATYFLKKIKGHKYDFGVCSRNRRLPQEDGSHYWDVARKYKIEKVLRDLIGNYDWIVLQGEITGAEIQGNKYPSGVGNRFWAFNLITPDKKYSTKEMISILSKHAIMTVPVVTYDYRVPDSIDGIVNFVTGKSQIYPREREGCVFRNMEENISFKCINPNFLLKNDV